MRSWPGFPAQKVQVTGHRGTFAETNGRGLVRKCREQEIQQCYFSRLGIKTHANSKVWGQWVGEDPPAAGGAIVLEWVARCDPKPLIIIDSVIAFHPGAENDSSETHRYRAQYKRLTAMGATVVLLHHVGKSETSRDYRGSSDYKASIDIGYKLTNLGDGARLSALDLRPFKQRFSVAPVLSATLQSRLGRMLSLKIFARMTS